MGRKSKDYFKSEDRDLHNQIKELKAKNRRLSSDNRRLIQEIETYKKAFEYDIALRGKKLRDVPLEKVIADSKKKVDAKKGKALDSKIKWSCHSCNKGHMIIIKYTKASGNDWYHRACSNPGCKNRTRSKMWHDEVKGVMSDDN